MDRLVSKILNEKVDISELANLKTASDVGHFMRTNMPSSQWVDYQSIENIGRSKDGSLVILLDVTELVDPDGEFESDNRFAVYYLSVLGGRGVTALVKHPKNKYEYGGYENDGDIGMSKSEAVGLFKKNYGIINLQKKRAPRSPF